jgi:hypothetical protein
MENTFTDIPQEHTYRSEKGYVMERAYFINNTRILHREDGPAEIVYDYNTTQVSFLKYRRYDKLHRLDGPAYISYNHHNRCVFSINSILLCELPLSDKKVTPKITKIFLQPI